MSETKEEKGGGEETIRGQARITERRRGEASKRKGKRERGEVKGEKKNTESREEDKEERQRGSIDGLKITVFYCRYERQ